MACKLYNMMMQVSSLMENDCFEKSYLGFRNYNSLTDYDEKRNLFVPTSEFVRKSASFLLKSSRASRHGWRIAFALDTGSLPSNNDPDNPNGVSSGLGGTRLGMIVGTGARQLLGKLNSARKNFPMKVFLLLLGFYTANALATILGQTGDWDVLVAGVVVAAIEGIGMLMYRKSPSMSTGRFQSLVVMISRSLNLCLTIYLLLTGSVPPRCISSVSNQSNNGDCSSNCNNREAVSMVKEQIYYSLLILDLLKPQIHKNGFGGKGRKD